MGKGGEQQGGATSGDGPREEPSQVASPYIQEEQATYCPTPAIVILAMRCTEGICMAVTLAAPAAPCSGRPPAHRMVLLVLKRIQGGMGRFCLAFLASFFLMRNSFWDGCSRRQGKRGGPQVGHRW